MEHVMRVLVGPRHGSYDTLPDGLVVCAVHRKPV